MLLARPANVEDARFAIEGHIALQDDGLAGGKRRCVVAQLLLVVDKLHAVALPADIGFHHERKRNSGFGERLHCLRHIAANAFG